MNFISNSTTDRKNFEILDLPSAELQDLSQSELKNVVGGSTPRRLQHASAEVKASKYVWIDGKPVPILVSTQSQEKYDTTRFDRIKQMYS